MSLWTHFAARSLAALVVLAPLSAARAQSHPEAAAERGAPAARALATPLDVYIACRHPHVDSLRLARLKALCADLRVPPAGSEFLRQGLAAWTSGNIPAPDSVVAWAKEVRNLRDSTRVVRLLGISDSEPVPELRFKEAQATLDSAQRLVVLAAVASEARAELLRNRGAVLLVRGIADDPRNRGSSVHRALALYRAKLVEQALEGAGLPAEQVVIDSPLVVAPTVPGDTLLTAQQEASRGVVLRLRAPYATITAAAHAIAPTGPGRVDAVDDAPGRMDQVTVAGSRLQLSASGIATGLTDVLLERASEQVQLYVITTASREMCGPPLKAGWTRSAVPQVAGYLPQTCGLFGQDRALLRVRGPRALRAAFESDLRAIPERLAVDAVADRLGRASIPDRYRDLGQSVLFTVGLVRQIEAGVEPLDVLARIARSDTLRLTRDTVAGERVALRLQGSGSLPLTQSLRRVAWFAEQVDSTRRTLREYWSESTLPTDTLYGYALRTLAVNLRDPAYSGRVQWAVGDSMRLVQKLIDAHREVQRIVPRMRQLAEEARTLAPGSADWKERRRELYRQFLLQGVEIANTALEGVHERRPEFARVVAPTRRMLVGARSGEYSEALQGLVELTATLDAVRNTAADTALLTSSNEREVFRVLSLAVSVSEAGTEQELNTALNSFVGQARDFQSKREAGRWRPTLNAYVGGAVGAEWLAEDDVDNTAAPTLGLSLPVGVELSGPCGWRIGCGFFMPLVDLGSIASARIDDDDADTFSDVELSRIVVPGLYFVLGFRGIPLSLGAGVSYAPGSRNYTPEDEADLPNPRKREADAVRAGIFLGVDIPLFP